MALQETTQRLGTVSLKLVNDNQATAGFPLDTCSAYAMYTAPGIYVVLLVLPGNSSSLAFVDKDTKKLLHIAGVHCDSYYTEWQGTFVDERYIILWASGKFFNLTTFNLQPSTFTLQPSPSTFNLQHFSFSVL